MSSLRPFGMVSISTAVLKPYWYSFAAKSWIVGLSLMASSGLEGHRHEARRRRPRHLRQRDVRERLADHVVHAAPGAARRAARLDLAAARGGLAALGDRDGTLD